MPERITLDPSELTTRTSIDITPWVDSEGIDWGDANIAAVMAEQAVGASVVDFTVPARQVSIPLNLRDVGGTAFATIRSSLQAKVGTFQHQGGYLKRVLNSGGTVFLDVLAASINLGGDWMQATGSIDTNAVMTLDVLPDWYGAEETLSDHVETTLPEITFTETTANGGDFPLGDRVRIVVDEDDADIQRGLFWHFRSRHYSSASTAASAYEAEALTPLDTATKAAKVGASGGTVVTHGTVMDSIWTPVLSTEIDATNAAMTHTGTYRVWGRVLSTSGTAVETRLTWSVGDGLNPAENDPVSLYDGGTFHLVDYGEVRLMPTTGTHQWKGQIAARSTSGTTVPFTIDRVWFQNTDEYAGMDSVPPAALSSQPTTFAGRDTFDQAAGTLNAKTAIVGGAWDTVETSFDPVDFSVETTGHTAQRTELNDTNWLGRPALLGSNVTACGASIDAKFSDCSAGGVLRLGLLARYTSASQFLAAYLVPFSGASTGSSHVEITKMVGGVTFTLATSGLSAFFGVPSIYYRLLLTVDTGGNYALSLWINNSPAGVLLSGTDPDLATGGTLASGRVGFYDQNTAGSPASTRNYDNFLAWTPTDNAIMFASQSAELSTVGAWREDSTGAVWSPVAQVEGDLPRMPNRSSAGTVEFMAKASRGDLRTLADSGIDDISARIFRRPSYLRVS